MKKLPIRPLLLCCLWLLFATGQPALASENPPAIWTAREAVRFALENSPDSQIGRRRIEGALAAIDLAKSAAAPQVNLVSQYGQTTQPMYSFGNILNQREFSQEINFNHPGRTDDFNAAIQLGYRFFDGGRNLAGQHAAEAGAAAAGFELAAVQDQLVFEVVRAFNRIAQAEAMVRIRSDEAESVAAALGSAQARYEEGVLLHSEVLDLQVQQSRSNEALIRARHDLERMRQVFLNLLGLSEGEVRIAIESCFNQEIPTVDTPENRAELASLNARINAARALLRQSQAGRYPSVDGYASYGIDQGTITGGTGNSWQAGLKLEYSLFDGHRRQAEISRAVAGLSEINELHRKTALAVELEINQARLALSDAAERLAVNEKSVALADESLRIKRERFDEGLVLAADLIETRKRLSEAQENRSNAEISRRIAIADLRRAEGIPQFTDPVEPEAKQCRNGRADSHLEDANTVQ